jgi:hypothetical protein
MRWNAMNTITPTELSKLLLNVATTRPVFIWGRRGSVSRRSSSGSRDIAGEATMKEQKP